MLAEKEHINIFKKNLKELMSQKGLEKADLVEGGFNQYSVREWLAGNRYPGPEKLTELAEFLEVPKSALTDVYSVYIDELRVDRKSEELINLLSGMSDENKDILIMTAKALQKKDK